MALKPSPHGPLKIILKSWEEASGRTLKSVTVEAVYGDFAELLVFRFTDSSGVVLRDGDCDGGDCYRNDPRCFDGSYSDDQRARAYLGIDSLEEYNREQEAYSARNKAEQIEREFAEYKRLKAKYGPIYEKE